MKEFFKMTGATVVGLFVFSIVTFMIAMMTLSGMMAASEATPSVQKNSVLVLKLDGSLSDHGTTSLRDELQGTTSQTLEDILTAIKQAKTNDKVAGIYLEGGSFDADPAQVEGENGWWHTLTAIMPLHIIWPVPPIRSISILGVLSIGTASAER